MSIVAQANTDYETALKIARHHWANDTDPAVIQAAAATVLIHLKDLRRNAPASTAAPRPSTPQAGQTRAPANARPAPASAGPVPKCPACGGPAWDNSENKKFPNAPDYKCKNKNCTDDKGRVTGWWKPKAQTGNTAYAQQHASPARAESFEDMPLALQDDSDDLPF